MNNNDPDKTVRMYRPGSSCSKIRSLGDEARVTLEAFLFADMLYPILPLIYTMHSLAIVLYG